MQEDWDPHFSQEIATPGSRVSNSIFSYQNSKIKGFAQSSNSTYHLYNNVETCVKFPTDMVSLVDTRYKVLDIKFHFTEVLIFDVRDPVNMNDYRLPSGEYHRFHETYLFRIVNPSSSFVVVKEGPQDYQNDPAGYGLCSPRCLHMVGYLGRHYLLLAVITSQYCGRSIGLYFDNHECSCQRRSSCIMYRYPVLTDSFSNCSFGHLQNILNVNKHCLFNEEVIFFNTSLTHIRCGNSSRGEGAV